MVKLLETTHDFYTERLTRAGEQLVQILDNAQLPVYNQFDFFRQIWALYATSKGKALYLRSATPDETDYYRLRSNLKKSNYITSDHDYGPRVVRALAVSDLPAEEIVCLVDPICYVSHLSAMQRWGLTDRNPKQLILTRPDKKNAHIALKEYQQNTLAEAEENPFDLPLITHPKKVRKREVLLHETQAAGRWIKVRNSHIRISTIGQTFLEMMIKPELCGGMSHVLDVWSENAKTYKDEIIEAVNKSASSISKVRAGHILEERLGIRSPVISSWKEYAQRGSSRKLDPNKPFASVFSEAWMLSLNV